jgi:hypothetical protein
VITRSDRSCLRLEEMSMSATPPGALLRCRGSETRGTNAPPFGSKFSAIAIGQSAGSKKAKRVHVRAPRCPCCCDPMLAKPSALPGHRGHRRPAA